MTAFDQAWDLLKMPFHGTTTGVLEGIRRRGLQPRQADAFTKPSVWYAQKPDQAISFANIRSDLTRGKAGGDPVLLQFPEKAVKAPNRMSLLPPGNSWSWTEHPIPASAITEHHGPPKPQDEDKWDEWQDDLQAWKNEMTLRYEQGEFS